MNTLEAVILAIIEGITEYLPVSSTGHMILASSFMGIASDDFTKLFTITIQLGAILAVIILYWRQFTQSIDFYLKLLIAFFPAVVLGLLFNDIINNLLERPIIVAFSLILGGFVLLKVDDWFSSSSKNCISYLDALKVGVFQCFAMLPGVSRSGASIVGGMSQGLSRTATAEFSFFLAVPTMMGATTMKTYDYFQAGFELSSSQINYLILGNILAFVVALIAIKTFIHYLNTHGFRLFGYYRIILGFSILLVHYFISPLTSF